MHSSAHVEVTISRILLAGIIISTCLVLLGGCFYLWQHGTNLVNFETLRLPPQPTSFSAIISLATSFTPLGIIELGLLILVITQSIRVAILLIFYIVNKDYPFTFISLFILIILIYSLVWRR